MKSTFHQSLVSLAAVEILFLVLIILDHSLGLESPVYIALFPHLLNPLKNILMTCETYIIMSIALERLLAVCRPIQGLSVNNGRGAFACSGLKPKLYMRRFEKVDLKVTYRIKVLSNLSQSIGISLISPQCLKFGLNS